MGKTNKIKPWLVNGLLLIISFSVAIAVLEIALRLLGIGYPSFYDVDKKRGHALIPNMSARWNHEGNGWVSINADGLRDRAYDKPKPENHYRIVVLGDSFSEAIQVDAAAAYWNVLEQQLSGCPSLAEKTVEVINFGVGDYGTAQQYLTLQEKALAYQPDLVLLQIFTGNDLVNNSRALSPGDRLSPFWEQVNGQWQMNFDFNQTATFQRRDSWQRRTLFWFINRSRLLQVLNETKRLLVTRRGLTHQPPSDGDVIPILDFDVNLYQPPTNEVWQQAWAATESLLTQIQQTSVKNNADFVAVTLSNPPQVYPDPEVRARLQAMGAQDLFYPDQRLAQFGERQSIDVITLAPQLQQQADATQTYWHGFDNTLPGVGHWNQQGHQFAAELISKKLCQRLENP